MHALSSGQRTMRTRSVIVFLFFQDATFSSPVRIQAIISLPCHTPCMFLFWYYLSIKILYIYYREDDGYIQMNSSRNRSIELQKRINRFISQILFGGWSGRITCSVHHFSVDNRIRAKINLFHCDNFKSNQIWK